MTSASAIPASPESVTILRGRETHLDGSLDRLHLDCGRFVQPILLHVDNFARLAIDTELVLSSSMLGLWTISIP